MMKLRTECCDGECQQGRFCSLRTDPPATRTDLGLAVVIVAVIAAFVLLGPAALHLVARVIG